MTHIHTVQCGIDGSSLQPGIPAPVLWWPPRGRGWSSDFLPNCCLQDACWSEFRGSHLQWCNWKMVACSFVPCILEIHCTSVGEGRKSEVFFTQKHRSFTLISAFAERLVINKLAVGLKVAATLNVEGLTCEGFGGPEGDSSYLDIRGHLLSRQPCFHYL